jgi:RNA polymerase sigma factor (sigma-70 family)
MDLNETTDVTALVQAAVGGDRRAWECLVDRYAPLVWSVIRAYRLSAKDAEDAGQMVWLALVEHLDRIREPRALPGWLATTTRRECLAVLRSNRRAVPMDTCEEGSTMFTVEPDFSEGCWRAERSAALLRALAELPEHQRDLLVLLLSDPPPSYDEISARLGIPKGSIGPTRGRALDRLRRSLEGFGSADVEAS